MLYEFRQSVRLHEKSYSLGVHEVDEKTEKHPFFLHMAKAGLVLEAPDKKVEKDLTLQERSKKLCDKLMGKPDESPKEEKAEAPKEEASGGKKKKG